MGSQIDLQVAKLFPKLIVGDDFDNLLCFRSLLAPFVVHEALFVAADKLLEGAEEIKRLCALGIFVERNAHIPPLLQHDRKPFRKLGHLVHRVDVEAVHHKVVLLLLSLVENQIDALWKAGKVSAALRNVRHTGALVWPPCLHFQRPHACLTHPPTHTHSHRYFMHTRRLEHLYQPLASAVQLRNMHGTDQRATGYAINGQLRDMGCMHHCGHSTLRSPDTSVCSVCSDTRAASSSPCSVSGNCSTCG